MGRLYRLKGEPSKSIPYLKEAIQISPQRWPAYFELGLAYQALNQNKEARVVFDRILESVQTENKPKSLMALAYYYQQIQVPQTALMLYRQAANFDAFRPDALLQLAQVYFETKSTFDYFPTGHKDTGWFFD